MNIDITQIAVAIIALLSAVITGFVIPWLKSKIGINNDTMSDNQRYLLSLAIETGVKAAEQLFNSDEGEKKLAYVISLLNAQGYNADTATIRAAIESAVYDVHSALIPKGASNE